MRTKNLCAIVYTELTDWYKGINGFITFDRKVIRVDMDQLNAINMRFREPTSQDTHSRKN